MRLFYDTEHDLIITEKQLYDEFLELLASNEIETENFSDYIRNCTDKNGTLEIITK